MKRLYIAEALSGSARKVDDVKATSLLRGDLLLCFLRCGLCLRGDIETKNKTINWGRTSWSLNLFLSYKACSELKKGVASPVFFKNEKVRRLTTAKTVSTAQAVKNDQKISKIVFIQLDISKNNSAQTTPFRQPTKLRAVFGLTKRRCFFGEGSERQIGPMETGFAKAKGKPHLIGGRYSTRT